MIITIRVPDAEGKLIRHAAVESGVSVPAYCLEAIRAYIGIWRPGAQATRADLA